MKTNETSTREQAIAWWNKLTLGKKLDLLAMYPVVGKTKNRVNNLTGREIEEIWKKEKQNFVDKPQSKEIRAALDIKYNQKQYSQEEVDRLLDQQAARTTSQILESNKKQLPVICLNCKEIYNNPIRQCSCGSKTFESTHISNAKQFKKFDESLFKAYIDKFSNEDLEKAYKILGITISIRNSQK